MIKVRFEILHELLCVIGAIVNILVGVGQYHFDGFVRVIALGLLPARDIRSNCRIVGECTVLRRTTDVSKNTNTIITLQFAILTKKYPSWGPQWLGHWLQTAPPSVNGLSYSSCAARSKAERAPVAAKSELERFLTWSLCSESACAYTNGSRSCAANGTGLDHVGGASSKRCS